jgi:hypothetical protein
MDYGTYLFNVIKTYEIEKSEGGTGAIDLRLAELKQLEKRLKVLKYYISDERERILKQRKKTIKSNKKSS